MYLSLVSSRLREVLVNNSPRRYLTGFYPVEIYEKIDNHPSSNGLITKLSVSLIFFGSIYIPVKLSKIKYAIDENAYYTVKEAERKYFLIIPPKSDLR